jgi:WD40 repeat protein
VHGSSAICTPPPPPPGRQTCFHQQSILCFHQQSTVHSPEIQQPPDPGQAVTLRAFSVSRNLVVRQRVRRRKTTLLEELFELRRQALTTVDCTHWNWSCARRRALPSGAWLQSHFGGLTCCAWSHDSHYIVTGGEDDLVCVFGLTEQAVVFWGQGHHSWITRVSFDRW